MFLLVFFVAGMLLWFYLTKFQPRSRIDLDGLLGGIAAGAAVYVCIAVIETALRVFFLRRMNSLGLELELPAPPENRYARFGAAMVSAAGEETLLRGYVFAWLLRKSLTVALLINFALTFVCYLQNRRTIPTAAIKAVEGVLLALIYWNNHSLFMVIVARFVCEILAGFFITQERLAQIAAEQIKEKFSLLKRNY